MFDGNFYCEPTFRQGSRAHLTTLMDHASKEVGNDRSVVVPRLHNRLMAAASSSSFFGLSPTGVDQDKTLLSSCSV